MKTFILSLLLGSVVMAQLPPLTTPTKATLNTLTPVPGKPVLVEGGLVQGDGRGTGGWYIVSNNVFIPAWIAETGGLLTGAGLTQYQDASWYPPARRHAGQLAIATNTLTWYQLGTNLTTWVNVNPIFANGGFGTNISLLGVSYASELLSDSVVLSYDGLLDADNKAAPISFVKRMAPLVLGNITNLLETISTTTGRSGWVLTNYLSAAYTSQWLWCPDMTTPDNGENIRRPNDKPTDADPGRWQAIPVEGDFTVDTMADLLEVTPSSTLQVNTRGFWYRGDGGNSSYFVTNSLANTNALGGRIVALGGAVSWQSLSDVANVRQFGARGDGVTDDTAAVQAAVAYQQASSSIAEVVFPEGVYLVSSIIANSSRLRVRGVGSGDTSVASSTLLFTGSNLPIFSVSGYRNSIVGMRIGYQTIQTETQTSSTAVLFNTFSALNEVSDCYIFNACYGIRTVSGSTVWNTTLNKIWVNGFSHTAIRLEGSGTTWTLNDIYIQNLSGRSNVFGAITNVVRTSGTNLVISCTSLPVNLKPNFFFTTTGLAPAAYNTIMVASSISGTDITCSLAADPGVDPSDVAGQVSFVPQYSVGPALYLGFGLVASITSLDIEQMVTADARAINNLSANVSIDNLYFESVYSIQPAFYFFDQSQGYDADIGTMSMLNCGFFAFQTGSAVRNNGSGTVRVGGITARDIAANGSSWTLGTLTGSATNNTQLGSFTSLLTVRANSSGFPTTYGAVVAPIDRLWDSINLIGSSGTKIGYNLKQYINTSGSSSYTGFQFDIVPVTEGSGTKNIAAWSTLGTNKLSISRTGLTTWSGPDGDLIFIQPNSGQISIFPFDSSSSFFEPSLSSRSSILFNGYGNSALNQQVVISADGLQSTDNTTRATNLLFSINGAGGNVKLGATSSTTQAPGKVVVGGTVVTASAILDVTSTTGGFLPPRMTGAERDAISSPAEGLVLFNTTTSKLQVRAGGVWVDLH